MNETDMELQAIRQKLQSLKAEPTPDDALAIPWSSPRPRPVEPNRPASKSGPDSTQVAAAIETLKQRSNPSYGSSDIGGHGASGHGVSGHGVSGYRASAQAASEYGDRSTVALDQAVQHFESQLQRVNSLADQQESAILALKQLADHIETVLHQEGGADHPDAGAIAAFFEAYPSVEIPMIERDTAGNYSIGYRPVDCYRAEHDAQLTAQTLRRRGNSQPYSPSPDTPIYFNTLDKATGFFEEGWLFLQSMWEMTLNSFNPLMGSTKPSSKVDASYRRPRTRFTFLDAAIWFSGAAIMRILLDVIFQIYPALWTPLVVLLIGVVAVTLYRTLLSSRPSIGFSYRILVALAGLLIGGQFL
ncbi:MAG: hypothetical protein AAF152_08025 [Cyanobacteria bacterium P01_A01_bin.114]